MTEQQSSSVPGAAAATAVPPTVGDGGLLHQLVDTVPVALMWLTVDGVVRYAAGGALTVRPAELLGVSMLDMVETSDAAVLVRRALRGEHVTGVAFWGGRHWQSGMTPTVRDGVMTGVACVFTDITTEVVLRTAGQAATEPLDAVIDHVREAILVLGPGGDVRTSNTQCARLFGKAVPQGVTLPLLLGEESGAVLHETIERAGRSTTDRDEVRLVLESGQVVWLLVTASVMRDSTDGVLGFVAVLTDITHAKSEQRRLTAAATVDPVTGVANRLVLQDRLQHALLRRGTGVTGVLFIDVDGLKQVNDAHGHASGDALLRHVATRLGDVVRTGDTLVRYGGDEFVAVCEQLKDPAEVGALAERMRDAVAQPLLLGGAQVTPTVSIGVATCPPLADTAALLEAADRAVYSAKRAGRDQVHVHE